MPSKNSKWTARDTRRATNSTRKETSAAWHNARDQAQKSGDLPERKANKSRKGGRK